MTDNIDDYTLEGLRTVMANMGTESEQVLKRIEGTLEKGWSQVNERIESLKELESVKEELINKMEDMNGRV